LFDVYAQRFDSHLVQVLNYSVPEKLAASAALFPSGGEKWAILDLGCGTGLSGAAIAQFARHMVGVDLSSKMLDKARERNLYARLEQLDLLAMMEAEPAASYDVVFAADVFVYLGKLDELVSQARRLLRPGGLFAFSVESLEALQTGADSTEGPRLSLNVTAVMRTRALT
jgi:predicted TPR repeat methyltransferase